MARNRQAKLAFSPVSPDSPAAANLSPQVRNRAAAVALDGSPSKRASKRQKVIDMSDDEDRFPSPDARELRRNFREGLHVSTQTSMFGPGAYVRSSSSSGSSSESDVPEPPRKNEKTKKIGKKKQAKLSESAPTSSSRKATESEETSTGRRSKRAKATKEASESEDAEPSTSSRAKRRKVAKPQATQDDDNDEEDELQAIQAPPKRHTRSAKGRASTAKPAAAPKRQARLQKNLAVVRQPSSDESSEEEPEEQVQTRATPRTRKQPLQIQQEDSSNSSDSDDEVRPLRRRIINRRRPRQDNGSGDNEDHDSDGLDEERQEILDDLEDLRSSPFGNSQRPRAKPRNKKDEILAKIRKGRAGSNPASEPASTPGRKRAVIHDSDDDVKSDSSLEIIDEMDEDEDAGVAGDDGDEDASDDDSDQFSDEADARDMFHANKDDEDFIVEDADEPLGGPGEGFSLPIEFSSWRYKKPAELFKFAVEWMVKKKISPAFKSNDEIYKLTFRKLDDELQGIANSRSSAAWTAAFIRAAMARPIINMNQLGAMSELFAYCEACNRKSHPATWAINFSGKPYDKDTLEPLVEDNSGSDDESDSSADSDVSSVSEASDSEARAFGYGKHDKQESNANGDLLPPESRSFNVGRTCAANARVSHTLWHWRYSLYTWVIEYLDKKGHTSGPSLVKLNKKSEERREKAADKIVKNMEKDGEIKKLHRMYKDQIKQALAEQESAVERKYGTRKG